MKFGKLASTVALGLLLGSVGSAFAAGPSERETAQRIDTLLAKAFAAEGVEPAAIVSDEDFLRRVSLDLAATIPTPKEVTLFGLNTEADKRTQYINDLLESEAFATTWASYWRDVIFMRATEQRAQIAQPTFQKWMAEQFEKGRAWDDITRDLLTATGSVSENGATGLVFAHTGDPQELTAEISRIFLGIQMSCANCHDHPTDSWKREQFHQLAAYLPRITVRREDPADPRSFVVSSMGGGGGRFDRAPEDPTVLLRLMDRNRDGKLAKSEARGPLAERFDFILSYADTDKDGLMSVEELKNARPPMEQQGRGSAEYYMPDLNDPSSKGKLMQPAFLIKGIQGPKLPSGADDLTRRDALADYITSKANPWFARAFVNRIWAEMLGEGFYMPIDDMGPERKARMEEVLDVLANGFVRNDYDVRWVYRTIANTDAYQREIRGGASESAPFAAATPTRLRSDQLYNAMTSILGMNAIDRRLPGRRPGGGMMRFSPEDAGKFLFRELFGFDPSTPQADLIGNVPQALFMMNSPFLNAALSGSSPNTSLGRILNEFPDNADAINELYLMTLTREPTEKELQITRDYIAQVGTRNEAFEDILWSLMNSTEFQSKR
jgi:hypothetical protein